MDYQCESVIWHLLTLHGISKIGKHFGTHNQLVVEDAISQRFASGKALRTRTQKQNLVYS